MKVYQNPYTGEYKAADVEPEAPESSEPSGDLSLKNIAKDVYAGMLETGVNFNKLLKLDKIPYLKKYLVTEPEQTVQNLTEDTKSSSWIKNQIHEVVRGLGGLALDLPTTTLLGATTKILSASTTLGAGLQDMSSFVIGAMEKGALKGAEEGKGISGSLLGAARGAAEQGTIARLYTGPEEQVAEKILPSITKGMAKFTAIGLGTKLYEDARQGKTPTKEELASTITQSIGTSAAFFALPILDKTLSLPRDKYEVRKLDKNMREALDNNDMEKANQHLENFLSNDKVSPATKEKIVKTINKAEESAFNPEDIKDQIQEGKIGPEKVEQLKQAFPDKSVAIDDTFNEAVINDLSEGKIPRVVVQNSQKDFIENKVKELGSVDAVDKFYSTDDAVGKYAREYALHVFGEPQQANENEPEQLSQPAQGVVSQAQEQETENTEPKGLPDISDNNAWAKVADELQEADVPDDVKAGAFDYANGEETKENKDAFNQLMRSAGYEPIDNDAVKSQLRNQWKQPPSEGAPEATTPDKEQSQEAQAPAEADQKQAQNKQEITEELPKPNVSSKARDKSVRDHTQEASVSGDAVKVVSYVGGKKVSEYTLPRSEWENAERYPNPNYAKAELIKKYTPHYDEEPGGPGQAQRIRDSQIYAINKAFEMANETESRPPREEEATGGEEAKGKESAIKEASPEIQVGTKKKVGGKVGELIRAERHDNVDYELWKYDDGAAIRIYDQDGKDIVSLVKYKDLNTAKDKFSETLAKIRREGGDVKASPTKTEESTTKPVRFEVGKKLTEEQKREVLKNIGDSYKDLGNEKVEKGVDYNGDPILGYPYSPEHMHTSDITGRKIRYYIKLPDGRIAHPTELFPNMTKAEVDRAISEKQYELRQIEERANEYKNRLADTPREANIRASKANWNDELFKKSYMLRSPDGRFVRVFEDDVINVLEKDGFTKEWKGFEGERSGKSRTVEEASPEKLDAEKPAEQEGKSGPTIIPYSKDLDIRNLDAVAKGTGARYLEAIKGLNGEYVASGWKRKPSGKGIFIDLKPEDYPTLWERGDLYAYTGEYDDGPGGRKEEFPELRKNAPSPMKRKLMADWANANPDKVKSEMLEAEDGEYMREGESIWYSEKHGKFYPTKAERNKADSGKNELYLQKEEAANIANSERDLNGVEEDGSLPVGTVRVWYSDTTDKFYPTRKERDQAERKAIKSFKGKPERLPDTAKYIGKAGGEDYWEWKGEIYDKNGKFILNKSGWSRFRENQRKLKEEPKEISIPPFRRFRVKRGAANAANLYPYRPGEKFSDEEIDILKKWGKENNLHLDATSTKVHVIRLDAKPLDLSLHGMEGVKRDEFIKDREQKRKEREEKRAERLEAAQKSPSFSWVNKVFGDDFTNSYNLQKLTEFLDGKSKKPDVVVNWRWEDGLRKLNAVDEDGKIKWNKIKEAYTQSREHQYQSKDGKFYKTKVERDEADRKFEEAKTEELPEIEAKGKSGTAKTMRGREVKFKYSIVPQAKLIASHNTDLTPNENYPSDRQPRNRAKAASEFQVQNLKNKLDPELLGENPIASDGAPIVDKKGVVESGNGRTVAIRRLYEEGGTKYKDWLIENAEKFGYDPDEVKKIKDPILVRVRQNEIKDIEKYVSELNEASTASMSATEQAIDDAKKLTPRLLSAFDAGENGEILNAKNQEFINAFLNEVVGVNEQGKYLQKDGSLSQEGVTRIRNAIFAKAYGSSEVLETLSESTDDNTRNITRALVNVAPKVVELQEKIDKGARYDLNISENIAKAAQKVAKLRRDGVKISTYLKQKNLFGDGMSKIDKAILEIMDKNKRSAKRLTEIFKNYINSVETLGHPGQKNMFGRKTPTKEELLATAINRVEEAHGERLSLFKGSEETNKGNRKNVETSGKEVQKGTSKLKKAKDVFKEVPVEDEYRYYGSKVLVKAEEDFENDFEGTIHRVVNNGSLIEVHPNGTPENTTFRYKSDRVLVESIKDNKTKEKNKPQPKIEKIPKRAMPSPDDFAAEMKANGVGRQESWSRWVQRTGLNPGMDAKDWYKIYDSVSPKLSTTPGKETVARQDLHDIFRKMRYKTGEKDGQFYFETPSGTRVTIKGVDKIDGYIDTDKGKIPVGSYLKNHIELKTLGKGPKADVSTAFHEFVHFAKESGIISGNDWKALQIATARENKISPRDVTEEHVADYVADKLADRYKQPTRIKRVLRKIADFATGIYEFFTKSRTARGVLSDIEKGKLGKTDEFNPKDIVIEEHKQFKLVPDETQQLLQKYVESKESKPLKERLKDSSLSELAKSVKDGIQNIFVPEIRAGQTIDAMVAHHVQTETYLREKFWAMREEARQWWERVPDKAQLQYIYSVEEHDDPRLKALVKNNPSAYAMLKKMALDHRRLFDAAYNFEKENGISLKYISDYFVHVWKDPKKAKIAFAKYFGSFGKDRFTKARSIDFIRVGIEKLGLELKTTNPEELLAIRTDAAYKAGTRMQVINELKRMGLAEKFVDRKIIPNSKDIILFGGKEYVTHYKNAEKFETWDTFNKKKRFLNYLLESGKAKEFEPPTKMEGKVLVDGPDGKRYAVSEDIVPLLTNSGLLLSDKGKSLWVRDDAFGKIYRTAMSAKNLFIPIKLGLSLFHLAHVMTIDSASRRASIYDSMLKKDISFEDGIKSLSKVSVGIHQLSAVKDGMDVIKAMTKPSEELSEVQRTAVQYCLEGGFYGKMSDEWRINAKEQFRKALEEKNKLGVVGHGVRRILEGMQKPIFEVYVPSLKMTSYLDGVKRILEHKPELMDDLDARRVEFRKLAKEIDNRYGELTYNTLFWNRMIKDLGIGSTLSMGWQLGFVREYGGGAVDTVRFAKGLLSKNKTPEVTRRMLFTMDYTLQSMLIGGMITYALTGALPKKLLDYFYPKSGETNPDGTEMRFNTPFYTREFFAAYEHIRKEGLLGGLATEAANKANPLLSMAYHVLKNKDYYGTDIVDPHAPLIKKTGQLIDYLAQESMPISVTSIDKSRESMSLAKAIITSELGFTKAPRYITMTPTQKEIFDEYSRHKEGMSREEADRLAVKRKLRIAIMRGEITNKMLEDAIQKGVFGVGKSIRSNIKRFFRSARRTSDIRVFSALDTDVQVRILLKLFKNDEKEFKKYFPYANRGAKILVLRRRDGIHLSQ